MNDNIHKKRENNLKKDEEKAKQASKLVTANKELAFQQKEKAKQASELVTANKELIYQKKEKAKLTSELVIANKELAYQQGEKADRASELVIANKELAYQQGEKADRASELVITLKELANQITLRKQANDRIEQIMYWDSLTGLPNHMMLVDRVRQAINLAKRIEKKIGILYLDLDGFKMINDTLGHSIGDELLKAVADRITNLIRESDTLARIGGDKFIIIIQNLDNAGSILTVTNKIIDSFKQPIELNQNEIFITVSIGISIFPMDGETYDTLIKNAELAMYKAKEKGKNQSVLCTTDMKDIIAENMKLSNGLYRSLERNELEVYYQPQINLNTKKIVSLEALLRWNHPEFGLILPSKFIYLAEQTGLINHIGKWVLQTVCMQNKIWQKKGLPPIRVAVNLSIIQFQNPKIVSQIKEILKTTKLLPQYLELEITESIAIQDQGFILRTLNAFQEMGIYISLDDFGTEFSSLQYLKLLPISKIKIPMTFIQGIGVYERDEAIIETIIILAKRIGVDVIAEGVETKLQESFLTERKCDEIQGFYYYKPMPAHEIEILLQENS